MAVSIANVEDFDPEGWNIQREGREWKGDEFNKRIYQAPEKIEYVGGIFVDEGERLTVLAMLLPVGHEFRAHFALLEEAATIFKYLSSMHQIFACWKAEISFIAFIVLARFRLDLLTLNYPRAHFILFFNNKFSLVTNKAISAEINLEQ